MLRKLRKLFRRWVFAPWGALFAVTLVVGSGVVVSNPVRAQEEQSSPRRVPAEPMSFRGAGWLERDERQEQEQPDKVVAAMALEPGDVVADIGCGSGYFTRRMARQVAPGGRVYGVDIQPEMLEIMTQLAEREGITGIEAVRGETGDPKLPRGKVDWILLADVYHELAAPEAMLEKMRLSLSPRGRVALLEYRVEDGSGDHIKSDHRMSVRQVLGEWKAAGFELVELHEFLPAQHMFVLRAARGNATDESPAVVDHDLLAALAAGKVEAEVRGGGRRQVEIRIRRKVPQRMVVTAPAGTFFLAQDKGRSTARDMIARRDAAVTLFEDGWRQWSVRAVGRQRDRPVAQADQSFEVRPGTGPLVRLMQVFQTGTYVEEGAPLVYLPTTLEVEQAALWIATTDVSYAELEAQAVAGAVPAPYAIAYAVLACDLAGFDVTSRPIWKDRERVFAGLRHSALKRWYASRSGGAGSG